MVKAICLNDKNKPNEIPASKWVVEGEEYHITHVSFCLPQKVQGCDLYEKPLGPECYPFECFQLSRFGVTLENLQKLIELAKNCTELDSVDVEKLIRETQLQIAE